MGKIILKIFIVYMYGGRFSMDTISKNFTSFDVFGMFIPGSILLFALAYFTGNDVFNVFLKLKGTNDIIATIVFLALCYDVGTVISSLGNVLIKILEKWCNNDIESSEIKQTLQTKYNYSDEYFNKAKNPNNKIYSTANRILRSDPKYSRITTFSSLIAISKSMFIVVVIIFIAQIKTDVKGPDVYLIDIILMCIFGYRTYKMFKCRNDYIYDYFKIKKSEVEN